MAISPYEKKKKYLNEKTVFKIFRYPFIIIESIKEFRSLKVLLIRTELFNSAFTELITIPYID